MLAVASVGVLVQPYIPWAHPFCGVVAVVMLALVIAKNVRYPHLVGVDLRSSVFSGVVGTFPMTLLSLSTYLQPLSMGAAFAVWVLGLVIFLMLVVNFLYRMVVSGTPVDFLTPASFVILIGPLLADLTGTGYGEGVQAFCVALFWVVLVVSAVDFVAVTVRLARRPLRVESLQPLACIYAAPFSMTLACLLTVGPAASDSVVSIWYGCACGLFAFALVKAVRCLRLPFYPSYASMTFPFVISATATFKVAGYFGSLGFDAGVILGLGYFQTALAAGLTLYVLVWYVIYLAQFRR